MSNPETIIELCVRSRRFGTFRKAVQVEDAAEELEREGLHGAVMTLAKELEKWCRPKWPDPVTAALANLVTPCPHCGGYPTLVRFQEDGSVCLACMNPGCKEHLHTEAFKSLDDERLMLAMWNHLCTVAREKLEMKEGVKEE